MQIKQTEQITNTLLNYLDQSIWKKVALKNITKMSKPFVSEDAKNTLKDFVTMSTDLSLNKNHKFR